MNRGSDGSRDIPGEDIRGNTRVNCAPDPAGATRLTPVGESVATRTLSREADTRSLTVKPGDSDRAPTPGTQLGRYIVLEVVGSGGAGIVCAAYDTTLDRKVALKLLRCTARTGSRDRLLREAQAIAQLSHPNIIPVYDAGMLGDEMFIAMEYVAGHTLRTWQSARKRSWTKIIDVYTQAARALAAAHAAGIIHRDFKPDNVLVGDDQRVRVVDFGLAALTEARSDGARAALSMSDSSAGSVVSDSQLGSASSQLERRLTETGAILGTPAYMSPEQHVGEPTDGRSDQYSFCVSLYEAIYRRRPFGQKRISQLAAAKVRGKLPEPPVDTDVPRAVHAIIARGLAPEPGDRWSSMDELKARLAALQQPAERRWLIPMAGLATVAVVALTTVVAVHSNASEPARCIPPTERLRGVWDEPRKQAIEQAFVATELSYARAAWRRVRDRVNDYAQSWIDTHVEACEATHVRGTQSDQPIQTSPSASKLCATS